MPELSHASYYPSQYRRVVFVLKGEGAEDADIYAQCPLKYVLPTFAPGVARDFYYLRKHQSFPTPGMLLDLLDTRFILRNYTAAIMLKFKKLFKLV